VKLFPSSRVYDDETLEQANQHVAAIRADSEARSFSSHSGMYYRRPPTPSTRGKSLFWCAFPHMTK
jgi:hypothetical protein